MGDIEMNLFHQLPFRPDPFKEGDQLQFEEDDRINRRPSEIRVKVTYQFPDKAEFDGVLDLPVEVVFRDQVFQGELPMHLETLDFVTHHRPAPGKLEVEALDHGLKFCVGDAEIAFGVG
jgi:hypothetical protein